MAETADYDPGPWKGHDFGSLRRDYNLHVDRSYGDAIKKSVKSSDCFPKSLKTDAEGVLVIACDVTGSFGDWPATIFSKLPYLDLEAKEYLGENMAISFAAVGDHRAGDNYPLQARPFVIGEALKNELSKLIIEGRGGGGLKEGYDIAGLYYARNVEMPNAIKPIFIFIADEGLYENLDKNDVLCESLGVKQELKVEDIFQELKSKFSVYLIQKNYGGSPENARTVKEQWVKLLGEEYIAPLQDASRVVDVIFGILAKETGRLGYFEKEINDRQKPEQVKIVMKSLATIHSLEDKSLKKLEDKGRSVTRKPKSTNTKPTASLLE